MVLGLQSSLYQIYKCLRTADQKVRGERFQLGRLTSDLGGWRSGQGGLICKSNRIVKYLISDLEMACISRCKAVDDL